MRIKFNKMFILAVLALAFAATAAGCGKSKEPAGGEVENLSNYFIAGYELAFEKMAPYETRMEGTTACADFSIIPSYSVAQFIEVPAGASIRGAAVRNISIKQPKSGKIAFDYARIIDFSHIEAVQEGSNSIVFPLSDVASFIGSNLGVQLNFISAPIGKYTLKNYEKISGTPEEAAQYFDKYVIENKVRSDDLRFEVKYRLELKVLEDNREAKYYRDIGVTMLPGDFISSYGQPVKTDSKEPFLKLK